MEIATLEAWLREAQDELSITRQELVKRQQQVLDAEERVRSLEALLDGDAATLHSSTDDTDVLISTLEDILEITGKSQSITELKQALAERGIPIPGQGRDANLIAKMQRSDGRIIRVGRGQYDIPRQDPTARLVFARNRIVPFVTKVLIGRSDDCDVIVTDSLASRHHANIQVADGKAIIEDLNSANGTLVNDRQISKTHLHHGDAIVIGDTIITFELL